MAKRGDLLVAARRLGFTPDRNHAEDTFVVIQSDNLNGVLATVVVVPFVVDDAYARQPLAVGVALKGGVAGFVLAWLPAAVPADRFRPGSVARLPAAAMASVDRAVRTALDLA